VPLILQAASSLPIFLPRKATGVVDQADGFGGVCVQPAVHPKSDSIHIKL